MPFQPTCTHTIRLAGSILIAIQLSACFVRESASAVDEDPVNVGIDGHASLNSNVVCHDLSRPVFQSKCVFDRLADSARTQTMRNLVSDALMMPGVIRADLLLLINNPIDRSIAEHDSASIFFNLFDGVNPKIHALKAQMTSVIPGDSGIAQTAESWEGYVIGSSSSSPGEVSMLVQGSGKISGVISFAESGTYVLKATEIKSVHLVVQYEDAAVLRCQIPEQPGSIRIVVNSGIATCD